MPTCAGSSAIGRTPRCSDHGITSSDAIRVFAGSNVETAVVPNVHAMMIDYDHVVRHYEIVE
jgi:hypothetical protein